MKISYNWLKRYINTTLSAQDIAVELTAAGLEVEGLECVESIKGGLQGLVVAEVLTCQKHPDADKLNITTVTVGGDSEPLQVVCGAPNCRAGVKVVLATVGTTLYPLTGDSFKIKRSKIRGVESLGMLCAEDEIGIGVSHDGIIILPQDTVVGALAADVFALNPDYLLEIGLTPNRVDAASHYGVARDLAAILSSKGHKGVKSFLASVEEFKVDSHALPIRVSVEDSSLAPRYSGVTVSGIKIGPSPEWMQQSLRSIGINPKNNVVDITNFVLHECGEPLHAFDMAKLRGHEIQVRRCTPGTRFTTLDGVERTLLGSELMICDAKEPMCMAGIFGGLDSGVSDTTTDVFIESAYFNPVVVRKAARAHGLSTDSSFRFERGVDPDMLPYAMKRAALLMKEYAGGQIASEVVDIYPQPIAPFRFDISLQRINNLIGKQIDEHLSIGILKSLEIEILSSNTDGSLTIQVPPYRVDVQRECDVAEEILRIYGFNNIENPPYIKNVITAGNKPTTDHLVETVSSLLASLGTTEIMNNSLTRSTYYQNLESYPSANRVKIVNPLSGELNVMRGTLLFGALESVALNCNRRNMDLKFFEIGNCYNYNPDANGIAESPLKAYSQEQRLAITITGLDQQNSWNVKGKPVDMYTLKVLAERIMQRLGLDIEAGSFEPLSSDLYDLAVRFTFRGSPLFDMGLVRASLCRGMDVKAPVYFLELNIERLQKLVDTVKVSMRELSKFQPVKRDLAVLVDSNVTFAMLRTLCYKAEKKLLTNVGLFDVYQGDRLPEGKKSYALNFVIEDSSKTLTDVDIERVMANIIRSLESGVGAQIRS